MDRKACDNLKSILRSRYEQSGMPVEQAIGSVNVVTSIEEYFASDVGGKCMVFGSDYFDLARFIDALLTIRNRPDVQDVLVDVSDPLFDEPDEWPCSHTTYILTSRTPDEVRDWIVEHYPDGGATNEYYPDIDEGYWCDETPVGAPPLKSGFRVVKVVWG